MRRSPPSVLTIKDKKSLSKIVFLVVFLIGCADNDLREFNHEEKQDPNCYAHYGAAIGYCDQVWHRGVLK